MQNSTLYGSRYQSLTEASWLAIVYILFIQCSYKTCPLIGYFQARMRQVVWLDDSVSIQCSYKTCPLIGYFQARMRQVVWLDDSVSIQCSYKTCPLIGYFQARMRQVVWLDDFVAILALTTCSPLTAWPPPPPISGSSSELTAVSSMLVSTSPMSLLVSHAYNNKVYC